MRKNDSNTTLHSRRKILAGDIMKIWRGEIEPKGTLKNLIEWGEVDPFDYFQKKDEGDAIKFASLEVVGDVVVENSKEELPKAVFSNCKIENIYIEGKICELFISDDSLINFFRFEFNPNEKSIERKNLDHFSVRNSKIKTLGIENTVCGSLYVEQSDVEVIFIENSMLIEMLFSNSTNKESTTIISSAIGTLSFHDSYSSSVRVEKESSIKSLTISNLSTPFFEVTDNCYVHCFSPVLPINSPTQVVLLNSFFNEIDFTDIIISEFSVVSVSNCGVKYLSIKNLCNFGNVFFNNIHPFPVGKQFSYIETYVRIVAEDNDDPVPLSQKADEKPPFKPGLCLSNSDLGKAHFINCDLTQFKRFEFLNTKMLDVFVAGSKMPNPESFCLPNNDENSLKKSEQTRLAYGQFKKIYEARGDTAGSLRYLAFEMEAYRKQLKLGKVRPRFSKKWWFSKDGWDNRVERTILALNKISTNYGNNWHRGFWMTVLVVFGWFSIYIWTLGYDFIPSKEGFKFLGKLFSFAPQYLNPFRDADSIIPEKFLPSHLELDTNGKKILPWGTRLVDYFGRVVVAYFVYQTIQAFRKLGKSSG